MLKITLGQIASSAESFSRLYTATGIGIALKFQIERIGAQFFEAGGKYDEARRELIKKHGGVLNKAQNAFEFEDAAAYHAELKTLLAEQVEILGQPINYTEELDAKLNLSAADLGALRWLLKFEGGEEEAAAAVG